LNPDVAEKLKQKAENEERSFSFYVNRILEEELQRQTQKITRKKIIEKGE